MRKKGWITPIFVFIVFMVCLFIYEPYQTGPALAQMSDEEPSAWHDTPNAITKIKLHSQNREIIAESDENENWEITSPERMPADTTYLYNIVSSFQSPHIISTVQMGGVLPEDFGIDEFSTSITLYDEEGLEYTLTQGAEATESTYYVYSPNIDTIYTMHQSHFDNLTFNIDRWRSKDFTGFDPQTTTKVTATIGNMTHTLQKDHTSTVGFSSSSLSDEDIDEAIQLLQNIRIESFVIDSADENVISTYNLDHPTATFAIYDEDGSITSFSISPANNSAAGHYVLMHATNNIYTTHIF